MSISSKKKRWYWRTFYMDQIKLKKAGGFVLPLVVFISILMLMGIAFMSVHSKVNAKNTVNMSQKLSAQTATEAVLQKGLSTLNKRVSNVSERILNGVEVEGQSGKKYITNDDIERYVTHSPASFWTDWMNGVSGEPNFNLIDDNKASFEIDNADYHLVIEVISAVKPSNAQSENTSGYNNVTLRYGYQITATDKASNKTEVIASSLRPEHMANLIQIHLVRELSRYNLFSINNTTRGGTPLFDRTSYTGRIYSKHTYYVAGTGVNEPRYSDGVEISNQAGPSYQHKDGIAFQFKYPNGTPNPPSIVEPVELPATLAKEDQKALCHKMGQGQNPTALATPGIYTGLSLINGVNIENTIFVNSGGANTAITIKSIGSGNNRYSVTLNGVTKEILHNASSSGFLVFVDGPLSISGTLAEGTKATVNATNTILITDSLEYESGVMSANTVLGLVSWEGDILVAKNIPPPPGQALKNLNLHGVIMTIEGAFGVEGADDFITNYPTGYVGTINHKGSFIRKWGLPTLSADGSKGWGLISVYDPYLKEAKSPPYFPGNGRYKILDENLSKVIDLYFKKS